MEVGAEVGGKRAWKFEGEGGMTFEIRRKMRTGHRVLLQEAKKVRIDSVGRGVQIRRNLMKSGLKWVIYR